MAPEHRLRQSGSRAGPLTTTLPPLKHNLKWLRRGMCPESSPPQPPQEPELKGSTAVHLVWPSATTQELLSIYEVTKALRFKKKHKLAQVCLTDWWWLSQYACMPCVQFGGSLMAIRRKRPRGLVGLSLSSAAPPGEPEPEFCVCLALPCRTPRAWNAACLPVVVLTRCPVQ